MVKVALAGNPNAGKTTLFNSLTGSTAHVGNWPGVTVDKKEGIYKNNGQELSIVDLPGIYSLSPYTPEEVISRNFLIEEGIDCVINVVDASNLERNLYLTTQILEIDVPVVIALNMMDVVRKNGQEIYPEILEKEIGVPVVPISASHDENLDNLMEVVVKASEKKRKGSSVLSSSNLSHIVLDCKTAFKGLEVKSPLFHAIKLIEMDELEVKEHPELVKIVDEFKKTFNDELFGSDLEAIVADQRYKYITNNYTKCKKTISDAKEKVETRSDKIDKVVTNKWLGIPLFLMILFLVFHLTFSENLFFLGKLINIKTPFAQDTIYEGLLYTESGINSIGVILFNFIDCSCGYILDLVSSLLANEASWVNGLLVDGVLSGIFAVLSFVPQILVLFLLFSILEDTGYMARAAFILDRIFRKFGLSGRAFMPMIMGFGCSVPAMMNTRTLPNEKERIATIRVIPFFSCGAKLPILTAIAGGISQVFGFKHTDLITYSMYIIGMLTAIVAIIIMKHTTLKGDSSPFIMELPQYRMPKASSLGFFLWDKLKHYIEKAFTIILASTIVIWALQSFTWDWKYIEQVDVVEVVDNSFENYVSNEFGREKIKLLNASYVNDNEVVVSIDEIVLDYQETEGLLKTQYEECLNIIFSDALNEYKEITSNPNYRDSGDSILAGIGKLVTPIFTPLGFGSQLNENGWVFGVSAVTGLIAKENVIATFTVLSQATTNDKNLNLDKFIELYTYQIDSEGEGSTVQLIRNAGVDSKNGWAILLAFIVFNMTTIPCFAAVATAKSELPKGKMKSTIAFWLLTSFVVSSMVYLICSWWWTSLIFAAVALSIIMFFVIKNKLKGKCEKC